MYFFVLLQGSTLQLLLFGYASYFPFFEFSNEEVGTEKLAKDHQQIT